MKKTLLVLLALVSGSAFAADYECSSEKGKIYISESSDQVKVTFTDHAVMDEDYFLHSFGDLTSGASYEWNKDFTGYLYSVTFKPQDIQNGRGLSYKNSASKLEANSRGSQDFSSFKVRFSFDKKKMKANIHYKVSAWLATYGRMNDVLTCVKL